MQNKFYDHFSGFEKDELFKVVLSPQDYQPEAVAAAKQLITEKKLTEEFNKTLEEYNKLNKEADELYEQEVIEKAEYYKNVVEFKNQGNSFQIRIADIPRFESALTDNGIDFFREDKNIGVQLDNYPTQTYFFKSEDVEKVDTLTKELELITAPYADAKPFFSFEIKVLVIVIVLIIIAVIFFN